MQVSNVILLICLLFGTYFVLTTATPHKIIITHHRSTSHTIFLRWRKRIGDTRLTKFKVAYIGQMNYHDKSNAVHEMFSHGLSPVVTAERILLTNLSHCTNYSLTISGWNDLTSVTNKPMYIKTSAKAVTPIVPSVATQLRSDGLIHATVTLYPNADNVGCKKYQLIVMLSDNITESQKWIVASLHEALTNQVNYIYIAAEFNDTNPLTTIELGDGKYYGKYLNKQLVPGVCYRVAIRIVYDKNSELNPTYSELSPNPWCLKPLVPATSGAFSGVNKSTAGLAIGIAIGVMAFLIIMILVAWAIWILCHKKGLFYSDKVLKGPSLWDVVRGKKGPTILEQLISVDYHEKPTYDYPDEGFDFIPSNTSIIREVSKNILSEGSDTAVPDDPETNKISSEGSETPIEHLYDDPATDSS